MVRLKTSHGCKGVDIVRMFESDFGMKQGLKGDDRLSRTSTPGTRHQGPLPETSNRPPNLLEDRVGCPFADRCPFVSELCRSQEPPLVEVAPGHYAACHHPG